MVFSTDYISLFKSFFYGRQDVHAIRWEKDGKSGYMSAYKVDWSDYNKYKSAGGTFTDGATKKKILGCNSAKKFVFFKIKVATLSLKIAVCLVLLISGGFRMS